MVAEQREATVCCFDLESNKILSEIFAVICSSYADDFTQPSIVVVVLFFHTASSPCLLALYTELCVGLYGCSVALLSSVRNSRAPTTAITTSL